MSFKDKNEAKRSPKYFGKLYSMWPVNKSDTPTQSFNTILNNYMYIYVIHYFVVLDSNLSWYNKSEFGTMTVSILNTYSKTSYEYTQYPAS